MEMTKYFPAMMILLLIAACAAPVQAPPPLTEAQDFPADSNLTAKGFGQSEAEARRAAMAALKALFQPKVSAETLAKVQAIIPEKDPESLKRQVEKAVETVAPLGLADARMGFRKKDEASGGYYALAVLDKAAARRAWEKEIDSIATAMTGLKNVLGESPNDFRRLQTLNGLMALWLKREAIRSHLHVIQPVTAVNDTDEFLLLAGNLRELRRRLTIFMAIDGEGSDTVISAVGRRLTENGYSLVLNQKDGRLMLQGDMHLEDVNLQNPEVRFIRATVTIRFLERTTNQQVGEVREAVRKGHPNRREAVRNAVESLAETLADKVVSVLGE